MRTEWTPEEISPTDPQRMTRAQALRYQRENPHIMGTLGNVHRARVLRVLAETAPPAALVLAVTRSAKQ